MAHVIFQEKQPIIYEVFLEVPGIFLSFAFT